MKNFNKNKEYFNQTHYDLNFTGKRTFSEANLKMYEKKISLSKHGYDKLNFIINKDTKPIQHEMMEKLSHYRFQDKMDLVKAKRNRKKMMLSDISNCQGVNAFNVDPSDKNYNFMNE